MAKDFLCVTSYLFSFQWYFSRDVRRLNISSRAIKIKNRKNASRPKILKRLQDVCSLAAAKAINRMCRLSAASYEASFASPEPVS